MHNQQFLVVIMTLFSLMTASAAPSYVVQGERDTARILKNSKDQKVSKNQKKGKSMKKSKKGGVVTSTPPPISSKSSLFFVSYSPLTNTPTIENYRELTRATQEYLEDFFMDFFDTITVIDLDNFLTVRVRQAFILGEPALVLYESNGLFNPDTITFPDTRAIDNLIEDALGSKDYLALIQSLPISNPFRETEAIVDGIFFLNTEV